MDDFGVIGMEVEGNMVLGQHQQGGSFDPNSKRKFSGGSGSSVEDDQSRALKPARNGLDLGLPKQMSLLRSASSCDGGLGGPQQQPQMVSFSSPTSQVSFLSACKNGGGGGGGGMPLSYYQNSPAPAPVYPRNAGYASESFTGIRGPFTPAQWIELEHQALIYKYLTANVPVPANLLIPIRKALISSGYSGFSAGSFPAHSYGWGPFHRGYTRGSIDPEPGRCRRTDGKKWRCSRDAVPEQKYCERHINRGRHRSRKPVESQTGQASSGPTNLKVVPTSSTTTTKSSSATSGGGCSSNNIAIAAHQLKCLQASSCSLSTDSVVNRMQGSQGFSMMPTSKDSPFTATKQHVPYEESPHSGFGFVSSESLLNPSPSYLNSKTYNSLLSYNDQQRQEQHQIRHESNRSTITWPDELTSNWTQLSMSMPMSELSSSSSNQEKGVASPLRLSHELDQTQMEEFSNWEPISWGDSMGDPLREVLNNASGSRHFSDSPTGVLQTGASASNSNSPRDEDKATHDDLLASCNS